MVNSLRLAIHLKSLSDGLFFYCFTCFGQSHECARHKDHSWNIIITITTNNIDSNQTTNDNNQINSNIK